MRRQLETFFRKRRTWATAYIALIPLYATIYYYLPGGSFHDSNLLHEQAFVDDGNRIRAELAGWIGAETTPAWKERGQTYRILPALLRVGPLNNNPLEGIVQPEHNGKYVSRIATQGFVTEISGIVRAGLKDFGFIFRVFVGYPSPHLCYVRDGWHLKRRPFVFYAVNYDGFATEPTPVQPPAFPALTFPPISVVFPSDGCDGRFPETFRSNQGMLLIPPEVTQQISRYFVAEGGDPAYASHL